MIGVRLSVMVGTVHFGLGYCGVEFGLLTGIRWHLVHGSTPAYTLCRHKNLLCSIKHRFGLTDREEEHHTHTHT